MKHHAAYWTYDPMANAYYFGLEHRTAPPYINQRRVTAILDIASDGTLAGIELARDVLPPPPRQPAELLSPTASAAQGGRDE